MLIWGNSKEGGLTMEKEKNEKGVYAVTYRILENLSSDLNSSFSKASLAELRASTGRDIIGSLKALASIIGFFPEEFLGRSEKLTFEENAILISLQLFASHQQGKDFVVNTKEHKNIGKSLKILRDVEDSDAIDGRFNAMITASNIEELSNHLRHLVKILRAKSIEEINYSLLAQDLYWYQMGYDDRVRLQWARSFYSRVSITDEKKEN